MRRAAPEPHSSEAGKLDGEPVGHAPISGGRIRTESQRMLLRQARHHEIAADKFAPLEEKQLRLAELTYV
jgi:hypothetical protein